MQNNNKIIIKTEELPGFIGVRIDKAVADFSGVARSLVKSSIEENGIFLNGEKLSVGKHKLKENDVVEIELLQLDTTVSAQGEDIPLHIIYEDEDLLIVNKPRGLVVHPSPTCLSGTLVNALVHHTGGKLAPDGGEFRPGIVHRIDKDTSGILVVAKTSAAYQGLTKQFSEHTIKRSYKAFVWGLLNPVNGTVNVNVGRSKQKKTEMTTFLGADGKKAITHYETIGFFQRYNVPPISFMRFTLETGRTHQIRVHMKFKQHPIIGDPVYSNHKRQIAKIADEELQDFIKPIHEQMLHAYRLEFIHPTTGKVMKFKVGLPEDMQNLLDMLEEKAG